MTNLAELPASSSEQGESKALSPAAERALAEAAARRAALDQRAAELALQPEIKGRGGLDPVRYQDWENKGIATDF
jgi:hypothetical protein